MTKCSYRGSAILSIIIVGLLLVAMGAGLYMLRQQQTLRSRASGESYRSYLAYSIPLNGKQVVNQSLLSPDGTVVYGRQCDIDPIGGYLRDCRSGGGAAPSSSWSQLPVSTFMNTGQSSYAAIGGYPFTFNNKLYLSLSLTNTDLSTNYLQTCEINASGNPSNCGQLKDGQIEQGKDKFQTISLTNLMRAGNEKYRAYIAHSFTQNGKQIVNQGLLSSDGATAYGRQCDIDPIGGYLRDCRSGGGAEPSSNWSQLATRDIISTGQTSYKTFGAYAYTLNGKQLLSLAFINEDGATAYLQTCEINASGNPSNCGLLKDGQIEQGKDKFQTISLANARGVDNSSCAQVETAATDPSTGQCQVFATPCGVPEGWSLVGGSECPASSSPGTLSVPQNLSAACSSPGTSARLAWNAVNGAVYYNIRVNKAPFAVWAPGDTNGDNDKIVQLTEPNYNLTLTPDADYGYDVEAVNADGSVKSQKSQSYEFKCPASSGGPVVSGNVPNCANLTSNQSNLSNIPVGSDVTFTASFASPANSSNKVSAIIDYGQNGNMISRSKYGFTDLPAAGDTLFKAITFDSPGTYDVFCSAVNPDIAECVGGGQSYIKTAAQSVCAGPSAKVTVTVVGPTPTPSATPVPLPTPTELHEACSVTGSYVNISWSDIGNNVDTYVLRVNKIDPSETPYDPVNWHPYSGGTIPEDWTGDRYITVTDRITEREVSVPEAANLRIGDKRSDGQRVTYYNIKTDPRFRYGYTVQAVPPGAAYDSSRQGGFGTEAVHGPEFYCTPATPTPVPATYTSSYVISENRADLDKSNPATSLSWVSFLSPSDSPSITLDYTFQKMQVGKDAFLFVRFKDNHGNVSPIYQRSIKYTGGDPQLTSISCSYDSIRGQGNLIKIIGLNLGSKGKGSVVVKTDAGSLPTTIRDWSQLRQTIISTATTSVATSVSTTSAIINDQQENNVSEEASSSSSVQGVTTGDTTLLPTDDTHWQITANTDTRFDETVEVELTTDSGQVLSASCGLNTTTVSFSAQPYCWPTSQPYMGPVNVMLREKITKAKPLYAQQVTLNPDGTPLNFEPKLEIGKTYQMIVKGAKTIAKQVEFVAEEGTNILQNILLPVGDVSGRGGLSDGVINSEDKRKLVQQWSLSGGGDRDGDFNQDGRVNSVDYSCMLQSFNQRDAQ